MDLKNLTFLFLLSCSLCVPQKLTSQPVVEQKIWKGNEGNDGSVLALGNGKMIAYESGPDILRLFPGPYSTPSVLKMELIWSGTTESSSEREYGTAIWTHRIFQNGKPVGTIVDFVDSRLPCLVRQFKLTGEIGFRLSLKENIQVINRSRKLNSGDKRGSFLLIAPAGTLFYQKYSYPRPLYNGIMWDGNIEVKTNENKPDEFTVSIGQGESALYFVGGPEYSDVIENTEKVFGTGIAGLVERTRREWKAYTSGRIDFASRLPATLPMRSKLLRVIDDVSVMLKTQQAQEGSVMAGYPYPLGYVRDQYGVSRCLLALGYRKEAERILDFYWGIWKKYKVIHNAQGIGADGVFHIHENDDVEVPGYIIAQAFDLLEQTGDEKFTQKIFPMLEWCWEVQKKHLARGMLPFNGDETYVAGGFLPRSALNDGSSEATMLFIDSGQKLLKWINKHHRWTSARLREEQAVLLEARNLFRENFWKNGQLLANNPDRVSLAEIPRFRHGVCERLGPGCTVIGKKGGISGIDWTERDENGRYQCPACLASGPLPRVEPQIYNLVSVSFIPFYTQSSLFEPDELKPVVKEVFTRFETTGELSCVSHSTGNAKEVGSVGYDYGLLLFGMLATGMKNAESIYLKTLSVTDSSGVWAEYYKNHQPYETRYRPWESSINLEALLEFAKKYDSSERDKGKI